MTVSETISDSVGEIVESTELAALVRQLPLEPRCRVCRNDEVRKKVNHMLATGASYAFIVRSLAEDNAKRDERDRVTIDSVRNHCGRHFPVQSAARATYRQILEERAKQNGIDFVNGVATALTPMALLETIMVRGYETLIDPDTKVDVNTAMIAAVRLEAMIESRAGGTSMVDMLVQMNRIINVVKSTVPEDLWPEILRKVNGEDEVSEPLSDDADIFDPDDDAFGDDDFE